MKDKFRIGYWDTKFRETLSCPVGEAHGTIVGPTRCGKDRDVLIPLLLSHPGSIYVNDPKLDLAAITARYRRDVLGQNVQILNPFQAWLEQLASFAPATYDPLSANVNPKSPTVEADAVNLVDGLMPLGGMEPHWTNSGRLLGKALSVHLMETYDNASLVTLYEAISSHDLQGICRKAVATSENPYVRADLGRFCNQDSPEGREVRSIVSTATTHLGWIGNRLIAENINAQSTIDFKKLREEPTTVYVGGTVQHTASSMPWIRVITNSAVNGCLENTAGKVPVLFILNEFVASVGKLNSTETLVAMGAGRVQLLFVLHDLPELMELYPKSWQSFLGASGFQIFMSPRELETSEYISKMAGSREVHGISRDFRNRGNLTRTSHVRPHLLPEEVRELPESEMLVIADGVPGIIRAGRRPHWEIPEFNVLDARGRPRYDPSPFYPNKEK